MRRGKGTERKFRGADFRFLLTGAVAATQFTALPFDDDFVDAGVGGAGFGKAAVKGRMIALGLEFFLETALGVGGGSLAGFAGETGDGGFEQAEDDGARAGPASFKEDGAEDGLDGIGEDGAALAALAVFLTTAEDEVIAQAEAERDGLEMMAIDELGAERGEAAFGQGGEAAVEFLGDGELEDGVAEKLEALVVGEMLALFVAEGGVGERLAEKLGVGKDVAETALKLIQIGAHDGEEGIASRAIQAAYEEINRE